MPHQPFLKQLLYCVRLVRSFHLVMKTTKIIFFASLLICCLSNYSNAQKDNQKQHLFRTWIFLENGFPLGSGVLYDLKDSAILLSNSLSPEGYSTNNFDLISYPVDKIGTIKVRKRKNKLKGILIGGISGLVIGTTLAFLEGDDPPCPECQEIGCIIPCFRADAEVKAIWYGLGLSISGGGIGLGLGSLKIKIPINGSIKNYNNEKNQLKKFALKKD